MMRLKYAAEVVLVYVVDCNPVKGLKCPAKYRTIPEIAGHWKECIDGFVYPPAHECPCVPLEKWPVRVGYSSNVASHKTESFANIKDGMGYGVSKWGSRCKDNLKW
jgi:hypothetical protein